MKQTQYKQKSSDFLTKSTRISTTQSALPYNENCITETKMREILDTPMQGETNVN